MIVGNVKLMTTVIENLRKRIKHRNEGKRYINYFIFLILKWKFYMEKGKYQSMDNTKIGIKRGNLPNRKKQRALCMKGTNKHMEA